MSWKKFSSGKLATSAVVYAGPCFYFGFSCVTGKTSFAITVYDEGSATGTVIDDYKTDAAKEMDCIVHSSPVTCRNGIYLSLGGGSAIVYYVPLREGAQ
jgi:hypothetical protein